MFFYSTGRNHVFYMFKFYQKILSNIKFCHDIYIYTSNMKLYNFLIYGDAGAFCQVSNNCFVCTQALCMLLLHVLSSSEDCSVLHQS